MFGIDCASSTLGRADQLKANRVHFVCRYLSGGSSKDITKEEADALRHAGINRVVVWEVDATDWEGGRTKGIVNAHAAQVELVKAGLRSDTPIYFAVDHDVQGSEITTAGEYIAGAASVLGRDRTGVYGHYELVEHVAANRICNYRWQTYAWSAGKISNHAQLYQYNNAGDSAAPIAGISVDYDRSLALDYGQERRVKTIVTGYHVTYHDKHGEKHTAINKVRRIPRVRYRSVRGNGQFVSRPITREVVGI